jgi:ATP-dependent Clp protease ATP-binding subunit ClpX
MFKKLFQFIKWKWWDYKNPQKKRPFGITCYVGLPGEGKTLSLVENLYRLHAEFPKAKIYTNFGFIYENGAIEKWQDLIDIKNGSDGVIYGLDEVQNIFNNKGWTNFPPEMMSLITQNRKFAKQIICTAQSFATMDISFRRLCHYIIECRNLSNRWIFQRAFTPEDYKEKDGAYKPRHRAYKHSFIASNAIYNSYDTYAIIKSIRGEQAP